MAHRSIKKKSEKPPCHADTSCTPLVDTAYRIGQSTQGHVQSLLGIYETL